MAEERREDGTGDGTGDGEWLTVGAAARRLGVTPRAVRARAERGTIPSRPNGNMGRLVLVRPGDAGAERPPDGTGDGTPDRAVDELALVGEELAEARVAIGRLEERVAARDGTIADLRRDVERERDRADRLEAEARRPWWRKMFG